MIKLDETTLIAYVDGELDPQTARQVEDALAEDIDAREFVEAQRHIVALSRAAFPISHYGQTPDELKAHLQNTLGQSTSQSTVSTPPARVSWFARSRGFGVPLALAASVCALLLGWGGGYEYAHITAARSLEASAQVRAVDGDAMKVALNQALEDHLSGNELVWKSERSDRTAVFTPIKTYKNKSGQYCRQYREDTTTGGQRHTVYGLACRVGPKTWKTKYLILEDGTDNKLY